MWREKDRRSVRASRWIDARAGETRHNSGLVHLVPRWVSLAALDIHRCVLQHVHAAACSHGGRPPTAVSPAVSTAPLLDGDTAQVDGVERISYETKLIPCHLQSCPRLPLGPVRSRHPLAIWWPRPTRHLVATGMMRLASIMPCKFSGWASALPIGGQASRLAAVLACECRILS